MNRIWELDGDFTNYLLAQQKLIEKHRHGAKVIRPGNCRVTPLKPGRIKATKRYHVAQTPYKRALAHEGVTQDVTTMLLVVHATCHSGKRLPIPRT